MALIYGVESYHVNINVGDATIYILYSRPANGFPAKKTVKSAVLIDGGKSTWCTWPGGGKPAPAHENINITIMIIEDAMVCQGPKEGGFHGTSNLLRFNAIVVTHWDADHSDGIISFLRDDILLKREKYPDATRLSRAIYNDMDDSPETIFYAPYWRNYYPKESIDLKEDYWPYSRYEDLFTSSYEPNGGGLVNGTAYIHFIPKKGELVMNILRMRLGTDELLGANFFNTTIPAQNLSKVGSVTQLVHDNPPGGLDIPGLYCVAVNSTVIGGAVAAQRHANYPKTDDQIAPQTTYKNKSSICNLIIWGNSTVSHYLAGDAHKELEEAIINWINWTEADNNSIVVAKLSHHGASSSNPLHLFTKLKPQHVVVSAGNNKGYGHPRWEVLTMMDAWSRYNISNKPPAKMPLYLTQYPIYMKGGGSTEDYHVKVYPDEVKTLILYIHYACKAKNPNQLEQTLQHFGRVLDGIPTNLLYQANILKAAYKYLRESMLPGLCFPFSKLSPIHNYVDAANIVLFCKFQVEGTNPQYGTGATMLKTDLNYIENLNGDRAFNLNPQDCSVDTGDWEIQAPPTLTARMRNDEWCLVETIHNAELFYIIPEDTKPPDPRSKFETVPKEHPLFNFLHWMPSARIILEHEVVQGQMTPLAASDEMQGWFRVMFGFPTDSPSAQLSFSASSLPLQIADQVNFQFTVKVLSGSGSDQGHTLSFDTTNANRLLGITQEDIGKMVSSEMLLPFVVTFSASQSWTLDEIATFVDFDLPFAVKTIIGNMMLKSKTNDPDDPAKGPRNALWYRGGLNHNTELRLEYNVANKDQVDKVDKWLKDAKLGIVIKNAGIIAKKRTGVRDWQKDTPGIPVPTGEGGELTLTLDVELGGTPFDVYIQFRGRSGISIRFQTQKKADESESMLQKLYDWLAATFNVPRSDLKAEDWLNTARENKFLSGVKPRAFELSLSLNEKGYPQSIDSVVLSLQIEIPVGDKEGLYFFTTFSWSRGRSGYLRAELWSSAKSAPVGYLKAMPEWEPYRMLEPHPSAGKSVLNRVDLRKLLKLDGLPAGIPSEVAEASLIIHGTGVSFSTVLTCTPPKGDESVPRLAIDRVEVQAILHWAKSKSFEVLLRVDMLLFPGGKTINDGIDLNKRDDGARIIGALQYDSSAKSWSLSAGIDNLTMSHLAGFIDKDSRDDALAVLGHLNIDYLRLAYSYVSGDKAGGSEFKFQGKISFGALKLAVEFSRTSGAQGNWIFLINAGVDDRFAKDGKTTVRSLLGVVFDGEDKIPLTVPGVVLDIEVGRPGKSDEILTIKCSMATVQGPKGKEKEEESKMLVMTGSLHLGNISLSFMQLRNSKWDKGVPSKRIVKVSVGKIGPFKAPLVGDIDIPIEQMMYLWVSAADTSTGGKQSFDMADTNTQGKKLGLTNTEFTALSKQFDFQQDQLYYKSAKDPAKIGYDEIVLEAGSHFIVVAQNSKGVPGAVLDYVFGRPNVKPKNLPTLVVTSNTEEELWVEECDDDENHVGLSIAAGDDETPNADVSKAPFKKSVGPLEIDNLGLKYDKDKERLGIVLDATFLLGPIGLSLLGFCFSVSLKEPKPKHLTYNEQYNPSNKGEISQQDLGLPFYAPKVSISGLIVSFDKPPLTVVGGFFHATEGKDEYYAGGLIIKFKPWMIKAMGMYSEIDKDGSAELMVDDKDAFSTVFVIFKLEGPLFSVGFADISGLCGGLGVNSLVRTPTAETVLKFPFVHSGDVDADASPLKTLKELLKPSKGEEPWFVAREGSFWAAAGLKVTAFQMLDVDAVMVIQLNPDVQLGIYGVAVCDVPSLRSDVKFAHAELGVACTLDIGSGTFKFEAQLSPRSYVLDKSCHLKGGIALFAWFQGTNTTRQNQFDGDWVLSIGGYHAAFNRPSHYPNPPRLGISWTLAEGTISITGEAYFAITPRVCMGGGRLHAALSAGPLEAWFDAALDFLINYDPFFFAATGSLSVGVRFTLDLWLVTIHIAAEIGASLTVAGPPLAGIVHVDFWVFGFDVHFGGDMPNRPSTVSLDDFIKLALKAGGSNAAQGVNFLDSSGGVFASNEDHDDWVAVENDDEKQVRTYADTTKPFLFNCTAGLTPTKTKAGNTRLAHLEMLTTKEQDKVWSVSGGVFSFSITLGFAASEGNFYDKRANSPREKDDPLALPVPDDFKNGVFALPMNLTSNINSKITVTIEEKDVISVQHVADDDKDKDWKITPIIKSVPYSVWGKYDQMQDPALHGNGVGELLNGDKNGSVPLVMGFTFSAPPAHLSTPERPKFDLVKDTVQRVMTGKFKRKHDANTAWTPRNLWAPPPPVPEEPDDDEKKKKKLEEAWKEVPRIWQDSNNKPEDAVRLWAARLRIADNTLVGKPPARLLNRFEQMVPALPMIAIGVA